MNEITFRIALLRKGLSQNAFAKSLGLHPQIMSNIVRGYRQPRPELQRRIAAKLDVHLDSLFKPIQHKGRGAQ
jgi:transcriptional regulator with XRE-family HTH domain